MANQNYIQFRRSVIETMEGRVLFSTAPIFGQVPPPIIAKSYPGKDKTSPVVPPPPQTPPPVSTPVLPPPVTEPVDPPVPVQPVLADAPTKLRARAARHADAICVAWKSVDPSAETIVVEASTDGEHFTMIAMLDGDAKSYTAKNLDRDKTYTFRVYTLDAANAASKSAEVEAAWTCKK